MSEHVFDSTGIGRGSDEITVPVEVQRLIAYAKATYESRPQHLDGTLRAPIPVVGLVMAKLFRTNNRRRSAPALTEFRSDSASLGR